MPTPILPDNPQPQPKVNVKPFIPPVSPLANKTPKDKLGIGLSVADGLTRALDTVSTRRMLDQGNHELFLPNSIVKSSPRLGAFEGGVSGLLDFAQHELVKHGHPKLGHAMMLGDIAGDLPWAVNNLTLPDNNIGKSKNRLTNK
jgi:hypothetical protein